MVLPYFVVEMVTFILPFTLLAILALALNLHWGHTGMFNAGVAGFYAIGAYAAAILITADAPEIPGLYPGHIGGFSQPFFVGLAGAFGLAALGGFLIGALTLKLRADYLAIATLALAEVIRLFLRNARSLTAGTIGIVRIPRPFDFLGLPGQESNAVLAAMLIGAVAAVFLFLSWITASPWGRSLRAVREDEEAAAVLGKDTFWLKLQAFTLGCGIMGIAGAFIAILNRVITPDSFVPFTTFSIYVVVLLGGSGNNKGVMAGAAIFYFFDWVSIRLKDFLPAFLADKIAFYRLMAIGVLLILLVLYRPQGVVPERKYTPKVR